VRVLIVKTSSLGDLVHTLPAVTDAARAIPGIRFDWVAEEGFAEIPGWHPAVERVIPVALRRWRKNWLAAWRCGEIPRFLHQLREREYDCVIDAQGLLKSAVLARLARGPRWGLDWRSAREPLAALFYSRRVAVPKDQHAIERVRQLFAAALGYAYDSEKMDYGLGPARFPQPAFLQSQPAYFIFLHGTTWPSKRLPAEQWAELARRAGEDGHAVLLPWGNEAERETAQRIAADAANAQVLSRLNLTEMAGVLAHAHGVIGVDTGLAHLAAALGKPALTIYTATFPERTGARGARQCCVVAEGTARNTIRIPGLRVETLPGGLSVAKLWNLWNSGG
jgi:heptosyltransferase-1